MDRATPDPELVTRGLAGEKTAFEELADRWYRPVCGFLLKRLRQPDLVEDLAQETFLEAFRALRAGTRPTHFSSWLFGIAFNRCGKWFRRRKLTLLGATEPPEGLVVPPTPSLLEEAEEQQKRAAALERRLGDLPEDVRQLLDLKHRQGLTCEQIAAMLGKPVGTVKSQLARTYKALRTQLGPELEEDG